MAALGNEYTPSLLPLWSKYHIPQKNQMWLKIIYNSCTQDEQELFRGQKSIEEKS